MEESQTVADSAALEGQEKVHRDQGETLGAEDLETKSSDDEVLDPELSTSGPSISVEAEESEIVDDVDSSLMDENMELKDLLQHTRADFENFRKQAMESARYTTVLKFLPLVDDLSRALATYPEQLAPLRKSFDKTLEKLGLEMIDSNPGIDFDPDYHEAVSVDDADGEREVIAETLRPGYLYEESVLRPAMVKVTHQ